MFIDLPLPILQSACQKGLYFMGIHALLQLAILALMLVTQLFLTQEARYFIRAFFMSRRPQTLLFYLPTFLWGVFRGLELEYHTLNNIPFTVLCLLLPISLSIGITAFRMRINLARSTTGHTPYLASSADNTFDYINLPKLPSKVSLTVAQFLINFGNIVTVGFFAIPFVIFFRCAYTLFKLYL